MPHRRKRLQGLTICGLNAGVYLWNSASTIKGAEGNASPEIVAACKYRPPAKACEPER